MDNKGSNNNNKNDNKNGMTILIFVLAALIVLFVASVINNSIIKMTNKEITYSNFKKMVKEGEVGSVEFGSGRISIVPKTKDGKASIVTYNTVQLNDDTLIPLLDEYGVDYNGTQVSSTSTFIYNILSIAIPIVILWIAMGFILRKMGGSGGGVMGVGKSTAKVYVEKQTGVTFLDVAGQGEAKESLQEVVDFLHNPQKYTEIGAKLPKGALLVGPPGTGKTLLAKAVAGEAKVPFFSLAGSDFVEMFVGVGASRVRDLFKEAQKQAPCIIFIDEIDAIGKSRDTRYGGNDEREQTLNQLLAEMDGFDTSKGILILAATNRPEVLDKALLRPGRFDRRIIVDKPDLKGRKETLKVHAKNVLMDDSVDLDEISLATSGAVGSDLANMINEAAINAVKNGRKYVNQGDLFESVEVVIAGKEKKDRIMGPKEKRIVAFHEVGHALVTALIKDAEPVQKITIVPRTMGALGYTMQMPEEEKFLMTKDELIAHLVTYMGGRAAEEIAFDSVTTGASNDIEQATKIARAMVTQYGMSEKFGLMGLVTVESQYLDGRASLNCGEETAGMIDKEVMKILQESYTRAKSLLEENRSILDEISDRLYENETITGKEFMKIFRKLKGIPEPEEDEKEKNKKNKGSIKKKEKIKIEKKKEVSVIELPSSKIVDAVPKAEETTAPPIEIIPAKLEEEEPKPEGEKTQVKETESQIEPEEEAEPQIEEKEEAELRIEAEEEDETQIEAEEEAERQIGAKEEAERQIGAKEEAERQIGAKEEAESQIEAKEEAELQIEEKEEAELQIEAEEEAASQIEAEEEAESQIDAEEEAELQIEAEEEAASQIEPEEKAEPIEFEGEAGFQIEPEGEAEPQIEPEGEAESKIEPKEKVEPQIMEAVESEEIEIPIIVNTMNESVLEEVDRMAYKEEAKEEPKEPLTAIEMLRRLKETTAKNEEPEE